jgi:hypothetical protein
MSEGRKGQGEVLIARMPGAEVACGIRNDTSSWSIRNVMRSPWRKVPPFMERTLLDDVLLAVCILVGAALGALVFGADGASVQGFVIGAVAVIVVLQVLRFVMRGVGTHPDE